MSLLSRLAVQAARAYGILSSKAGVSAEYLVVAGGGGGASGGGGGGAGGLLTSTFTLSTLNTYSITVGAGGLGGVAGGASQGANGSNSVVSGTGLTTVTSIGGGGTLTAGGVGNSGGSGGGGGSNDFGANSAGGAGTAGQGNNGGASSSTAQRGAGGGGGAGAVGGTGTTTAGGNGGNGLSSSISGSSVTYAGGGGGGSYSPNATTGGSGGTGGGGAGTGNGTTNATSGTANLGGGGGGGGATSGVGYGNGGNGGSGIVIISYTSATPKFVGGTITTSGGKQIHTFTSSGTLSPITPITASYLVVAGGASGGDTYGGGGGAGGLQTGSTTIYSGATYVVTVGAGGAATTSQYAAGNSGSNSVLSGTGLTTITSIGGGAGGGNLSGGGGAAATGGSGGGGGAKGDASYSGAAGTSGQGYAGGNGSTTSGGGGGGGSSAVGSNGSGSTGGAGGAGTASSITGTSVTYAGGGGGGASGTGGAGGSGGGGAGGGNTYGVSGTTNTGSGGGGSSNATSGKGGSGIVIISYAGSQVFNGGLVTTSGGNTIHTFTSTGALTPLTNNLNNSLRFRKSATAYLSRTPTVAGNRTTFTWSAWVKRGDIPTSEQVLFSAGSASNYSELFFLDSTIAFQEYVSGVQTITTGTPLYRDPSAWYHIVFVADTTNATAANRLRLYINGNQQTGFSGTSFAQNRNLFINSVIAHTHGVRWNGTNNPFDGYMTDINFIDGQALEPYYFGNNDANGVWKPIQYKGTYGTNGFYLTFGNTTSTTTLGYDSSPNGNNWTCNNISLTAGTTYDAMTDVPTNTSATVGNYCVLNPLAAYSTLTIKDGNLNITNSSDNDQCTATFGMTSGKWYWECVQTGGSVGSYFGIAKDGYNSGTYTGGDVNSWGFHSSGSVYNNASGTAYGNTWTVGDIIGVAFDADNGKIYFSKNGTWQNSGNPATSTNPAYSSLTSTPYFPAQGVNSTAGTVSINFGQRPFSYTPPTGFVALNTYNLPTPTILQGNKYMDATLYTGNGVTQVVVNNAQFKPDFVWIKNRTTGSQDHGLFDSIRGATKTLYSDLTNAEATVAGNLTAFNSNGFSVGSENMVNQSTANMIGWQWQAGQGSTSSNTSGSITSTVSVNATAGFSVVTWTSNGVTGATIGHGLGVAPKFMIIKSRSNAGAWPVYSASIGNTGCLFLNTTDSTYTSVNFFNNTTPTSSVFTTGASSFGWTNGTTWVAYCWAEIAGFSKFGSYTGNGSADGVFVYLGFRPKFIMIKNTTTAGYNWTILDTSRDTYNYSHYELYPNTSGAEVNASSSYTEDILSNGFKIRQTDATWNASGSTYVYAAFAEHPFKNANAR